MKKLLFCFFVIFAQIAVHAQGVKIGGAGNPDAHAILELDGSSGKGLLLPRVSAAQMTAMAAPDGMIVYNNTDGSLYLRKNATWQMVVQNNNNGGFSLPLAAEHTVDNGYVLNLTNNSVNGVNGAIRGHSTSSGYGVHGSSHTGPGGYFSSITGAALTTGTGPVGLGTMMPDAKLHIRNAASNLLLLENNTALGAGQNTRTLFKTGAFYTGAIGSTGIGSLSARMSFFAGLSSNYNTLEEKMSILENGNVGIGTVTPSSRLQVLGKSTFSQGAATAAVEVQGAIKVSGQVPAAFTISFDEPKQVSEIIIDNPACNGDPNSMLFVTQTGGQPAHFQVRWDAAIQKWKMYTTGYFILQTVDNVVKGCDNSCLPYSYPLVSESFFYGGQKFNVLVIKK